MIRIGGSWLTVVIDHPFFPRDFAGGEASAGGSMSVHAVQEGSGAASDGSSSGAKRADCVLDMSARSIQIVSRVVLRATSVSSPETTRRYQRASTGPSHTSTRSI